MNVQSAPTIDKNKQETTLAACLRSHKKQEAPTDKQPKLPNTSGAPTIDKKKQKTTLAA